MMLHPTVAAVTARIVEKSRETRADYIRRMDAARNSGAGRAKLSCANWAHAFAGQTIADKLTSMDGSKPNLGIVTAYNDMLSAHQPFERFPDVVRAAVREHGFVGLKCYHCWSTQTPTFTSEIGGYLPDHLCEAASELGLTVTLHLVRATALSDAANQHDIRRLCEAFPGMRLILAHAARGFNMFHTADGLPALAGLRHGIIPVPTFRARGRERICWPVTVIKYLAS